MLLEECGKGDWSAPLAFPPNARGPAVALGKFDAMHRGHRALAAAAAATGGTPWLLSFSGMAAALGWPPRAPLVAPDDRGRVLGSWAAACRGTAPRQRVIPFGCVREMAPDAFVEALASSLRAAHVVVGSGYRFGHRAAGDELMLKALCAERGVGVTVVPLVPAGEAGADAAGLATPVSSSTVREALAEGLVASVEGLLGRRWVGGEGSRSCVRRARRASTHPPPPPPPPHTGTASSPTCPRPSWRPPRADGGLCASCGARGLSGVAGWPGDHNVDLSPQHCLPHPPHSIPLPCFQNQLPRAQQYVVAASVAPLGGSPGAGEGGGVRVGRGRRRRARSNAPPAPPFSRRPGSAPGGRGSGGRWRRTDAAAGRRRVPRAAWAGPHRARLLRRAHCAPHL